MNCAPRIYSYLSIIAIVLAGVAHSQPTVPKRAENAKILAYIDKSWDELSRSMTDCKSLIDPKVTTPPILYLPAGMAVPPAVASVQKQCKIEVRNLPRKINHMGDVRVAEIPDEGLLYLPNPYVVPGGRFNEMYGWDSYFIILGLVEDKRTDLRSRHGRELLLRNRELRGNPQRKPHLLLHAFAAAISYFDDSRGVRTPHRQTAFKSLAGQGVRLRTARLRPLDLADRTSPEIPASPATMTLVTGQSPRWPTTATTILMSFAGLLAHPEVHTDYLVEAPDDPTPAQAAELAKTSCDITTSKVCAHAHVDGHRLSSDFYRGDRAMRESGYDPSFRFGPFSGSTHHYAPVCLNSLLYKYERDMAHFATLLGRTAEAGQWNRRALDRRAAIEKYLWNPATHMFYDYNFTTHQQSTYNYLTAFYPLWANLASPQQASEMKHHLSLFEHDGGLAMSDYDSGTQWDLPFGWAPTSWLAIKGSRPIWLHSRRKPRVD